MLTRKSIWRKIKKKNLFEKLEKLEEGSHNEMEKAEDTEKLFINEESIPIEKKEQEQEKVRRRFKKVKFNYFKDIIIIEPYTTY
tara:strand:- start:466 stop:717 length:252 start_codon:yes stop_codon:yes gene_type:complete